ncbi:hypothetical protein [Jatrophihabitans fulvus]
MTSPQFTQESWARDLLTRMGYPVTTNNMTSVMAWEYAEGGHFNNAATFNPLNSTRAHGTYGSMNSVGVATYPDYETGMTQTIKTLNLPYYAKVRESLAADASPATTTAAVSASPWGTWHGDAHPRTSIGRAEKYLQTHPVTPVTPAPDAGAGSHPLPVPAPTATPTPATSGTGGTSGSFRGADVEGLDGLSRDFTQAAEIVDGVRTACEAIVAAASIFGPFGAAFVAYLKGTVIPWLTKIEQALRSMSQVLATHSQAQKDASSAGTSLPTYTSTGSLPVGNTADYPLLGQGGAAATGAPVTSGTPAATIGSAPLIGAL